MNNKNLFYNQQWHGGEGPLLQSENPATAEIIWRGNCASAQQVDAAVESARQGFDVWSMTDLQERIQILQRYRDILKNQQATMAELISRETGKPRWEATTEAGAMVGKIDLSIQSYQQRSGESSSEANGIKASIRHKPIGVMAVFGPYNFPGHLPNGHIVPALLAGNAVVYKPSDLTPMVAEQMVCYLIEAGVSDKVINLVQGGAETGKALAGHSQIDGLLFTGSSATGQLLHHQFAGNTGKLLALEMGGNNPLIVHQTRDTDAAVYNMIQSAFITAGQRCTCARRLIMIKGTETDKILEQLIGATANIEVGGPSQRPEPFMGPVISNQAAQQLLDAQQHLTNIGGRQLLTMQRLKADTPLLSPGIIDVSDVADLPDQEYFGPLLQVRQVDDFEQAIIEANNTRFGLAAGILTDNDELWQQFYQRSRAGIVNRNRPLTGASGAAPFGGIGASGNHRPSAFYAADYSAYPVASLESDQLQLPESLACGIRL